MPFTEENKPLYQAAVAIDFKLTKNGMINYRKHTTYERGLFFIKQAVEKNGNRYGYSKVNYVSNNTKITITCNVHGDFEQTPSNHLTGYNCPKCAGNHSPTIEEFIKRARGIHQDKYDYSSVHYKSSQEKVEIICRAHGPFEQTPSNHISGQGCPKCYLDSRRLSLKEFIQRAEEAHGNRYDYSSVQYRNSSENVTIICHVHGPFDQTPDRHIRGGGCAQCYYDSLKMTQEDFMKKAKTIHGDKYDYSLVRYSTNKEKVTIICSIHGPFDQTPSIHLSGSNCPQCSRDSRTLSTEEFIDRARIIHKDKYDYSKVIYKNAKEKIEIVCPLHGPFFQLPHSHLSFNGCAKCAGHNHNILYLLKCLDTGWYKIGITTDNVQKRMVTIGGNLEEVYHVKLEEPRKHESILHKQYANDREYNLGVRDGNTEFFSLTEEQVQEVIEYMNEVSSNA